MFNTFRVDIDPEFIDILEAKLCEEDKEMDYFSVVRVGDRFNVGGVGSFVSNKLYGAARKIKYFKLMVKRVNSRVITQLIAYQPDFLAKIRNPTIIGIDLGVNRTIVTSANEVFELDFGVKLNIARLCRLKRKLRNKQKDSRGYLKLIDKINKTKKIIKEGIRNWISRTVRQIKTKHKKAKSTLILATESITNKPNFILKYSYLCLKRACLKRRILLLDTSPAVQNNPEALPILIKYERDIYAAIKIAKKAANALKDINPRSKFEK